MKCPKCQMELPEGKLYCEKCGNEVQIVPDFEPEIEGSIHETLSSMAEGLREEPELLNTQEFDIHTADEYQQEHHDFQDENERPDLFGVLWNFFLKNRVARIILAMAIILTIAILLILSLQKDVPETFDDYYKQALAYAETSNYSDAITAMEKALILDPNQAEAHLILGDYYLESGDASSALLIYESLMKNNIVSEEAMIRIAEYYISMESYEELNDFLLTCENENVQNTYQSYMAMEPIFSLNAGTYNEVSPLKITANSAGIIYYTLDGSEPNEGSNIYTAPIMLEFGTYTVKAFFINENGIKSATTTAQYIIDVTVPLAPVVNIESGSFEQPSMIEVEVPKYSTVYYTIDGTMPTNESTQYVRPIPMPLGKSSYQFVTYSQENVPGEVTKRDFDLQLSARFSSDEAVLITLQNLINSGILTDMAGHVEGMSGRNVYYCSSAFTENEVTYYLVTEYYEDLTGNWYSTGSRYAVDISTGIIYRVELNEEDYIHVISF